jgi:hypothetical protein
MKILEAKNHGLHIGLRTLTLRGNTTLFPLLSCFTEFTEILSRHYHLPMEKVLTLPVRRIDEHVIFSGDLSLEDLRKRTIFPNRSAAAGIIAGFVTMLGIAPRKNVVKENI